MTQEGGGRGGEGDLISEGPFPLYRELPKGEDFPVEALGAVLGDMALALHEAATRSPLAITSTAVLATAAVATQALRNVVLPFGAGTSTPISLNFLVIAKSGERKSATDTLALHPVEMRSKELQLAHDAELAEYRNAFDVWTSERARILKGKSHAKARKAELDRLGPEPRAPKVPLLTVGEPTIEGLTKHLIRGYPSLGLFSAEGGEFIGGHALSADSKRRSAAALNKIWDNGKLERIRASEDAIILMGRRLSVFLQAQPDVAHEFLSDPVLNDIGLLARYLATQPETMIGYRPYRQMNHTQERAIAAYNERTLSILRYPLPYDERGQALEPPRLPLSNEAREVLIAFSDRNDFASKPGGEFFDIPGFASKLAEHAARIAGVLAVYEDPGVTELGSQLIQRGILIARYYASEAVRLFTTARVSYELRHAERLLHWLQAVWTEPYVTVRIIQRRGPNSIRDKATAERLLRVLASHGWVVPAAAAVVDGKRTRRCWQIFGKSP